MTSLLKPFQGWQNSAQRNLILESITKPALLGCKISQSSPIVLRVKADQGYLFGVGLFKKGFGDLAKGFR